MPNNKPVGDHDRPVDDRGEPVDDRGELIEDRDKIMNDGFVDNGGTSNIAPLGGNVYILITQIQQKKMSLCRVLVHRVLRTVNRPENQR